MRTSHVVTISLPSKILTASEQLAKKKSMTRSELIRDALREYLELAAAHEAIRVAETEQKIGKMKILPRGGLAKLMRHA